MQTQHFWDLGSGEVRRGGGRGNFVRDVDGSTAATREAVDCTTVPDVVSTACTFTLSLQLLFSEFKFYKSFFQSSGVFTFPPKNIKLI